MGYQMYAGNGLLDGITTGLGLRKAYDEMKRQRGLADGMRRVAEGDETGWQQVAENSPETYMQQKQWDARQALAQKQFDAQQGEAAWKRQYENELLGLKRKELENKDNRTQNMRDFEYFMGLTPEQREEYIKLHKSGETNESLSPYDKTKQVEQAKNDIEVERGEQDFQKMLPAVQGALNRAKESLASGNGIGPIGGRFTSIGFNPIGKAAENYANIESANTQMNQLLRAKLKATGLTGSELNSAIEANAYRYTISPTDNESVVLQKIKNFETDILGGGKQEQPKKSKYVVEEVIE